ncbi:AraC family transcriptional regulator [Spongiactinospora rosea]|uniref:AraC family transcriptional regulator n=1 Tax=Spongiactinospora rosea TaxID=2248750 RepID=A0A366M5Z1_9ACTN|nr:helix-turn-helix domain-containing protein [Spongiactinospora rosea]RBQ20872.1 AraC family transcriptional regulator [Spongiactinospora rosea]
MPSNVRERGAAAGWDVARPVRPSRVPGVVMAGFRDRGPGPFEVRVVPHPAVTLAVEFGDGPLVVDDAAGRRHRGTLAVGLAPGAVRVSGENTACVQVRLSPLVAHAVLGDLEHDMVPLADLWGRDAARLRERLGEARSWEERFALLEAVLVRRCEAGRRVDPEVAWAWDRTVGSRGWVRIEDLAAELGWSRKRLWSRFRAQIGLPPKRAAKLVRFDHAAHRLAAGERPAHVAADAGYVDQSHLHREVRAFAGTTPATMPEDTWLAVDDLAWVSEGR